MKSPIFIIGAFLLAAALTATGAEKDKLVAQVDPAQIEVSLLPDRAEISLGEPLHLTYLVRNLSDRNLQVSVGGDYQNGLGRPDTFTVVVQTEAGATIPKREAFPNMGGIGFAAKVPALGTYRFRLFLAHWAIVKEPGVYQIKASRVLNFTTEADEKFGDLPTEAAAKITVTPADPEKLGTVISALGKKVLAPRSQSAEEWTDLLEIGDDRVIPILRKALEQDDYSVKFQALSGLARFRSDEALAGLRQGMAVMAVGNATNQKLREELAVNIRHCAAISLTKSPNPGALPFLLTQRHDKAEAVRVTVLHAIAQKLEPAQARPLLQELAADEDERVSGEAKRYLKQLQ